MLSDEFCRSRNIIRLGRFVICQLKPSDYKSDGTRTKDELGGTIETIIEGKLWKVTF